MKNDALFTSTNTSHRLWILISIAGAIFLFISLRWNNINTPLVRDEGEYAYAAWLLKQGFSPYTHSFMQKPPMIVYTFLIGHILHPEADWIFRLVTYFFLSISTALLGLIAYKEAGKAAGIITIWIVTPLILYPQIQTFNIAVEKLAMLPIIGIIALYVFKRSHAISFHWLIGGCFSSIAILYKPTVILFIFYIFSFHII